MYSVNKNGALSEAPSTRSTIGENDNRKNERANDELSDDDWTSNSGEVI